MSEEDKFLQVIDSALDKMELHFEESGLDGLTKDRAFVVFLCSNIYAYARQLLDNGQMEKDIFDEVYKKINSIHEVLDNSLCS